MPVPPMSMTQDAAHLWLGALWLVPFLIVIFFAGKVLAFWINARFRKALSPLLPVVNGRLGCDGMRGQLYGTHRGKAVKAEVITDARSNLFRGHVNERRNLLTIEFEGPSGLHDWRIYRDQLRAKGPNPEEEAELAARMQWSGALAVVQTLQTEVVISYNAKKNVLTFEEDIRPALAPSIARFQQQLTVLERLSTIATTAEMNARQAKN